MGDDHDRRVLAEAVRSTLAAGSARVRYAVDANPTDLADVDHGEGVANFRDGTSHVTYSVAPGSAHPGLPDPSRIEQIVSGDTAFFRFAADQEWEALPLGGPDASGATADVSGYLELLSAPREVTLVAIEEIDGQAARRYAVVADAPPSALRDALATAFRRRASRRVWLDAWIDVGGRVRRVDASNRAPNPDATLPRGTVRTRVELYDLGTPASVDVPRVHR